MRSSYWMLAALTAAAGGMLAPSAVRAQAEAHDEPACPDEDMEKDGLCGFARAAIARIEAQNSPGVTPSIVVLEAQDDTDITHCFLDLEIKLSPNPSNLLIGSNTLDVTSKTNGLTQFTLDLRSNMTVSSVLVNGVAATFSRPTDQIVINLGDTYDLDETFQVKVSYSGVPISTGSMDSAAFTFRTHSGTSIVSSLSQGFYAHRWWPCKENRISLEDKFTADVWITAPSWMTVASNGALQGTDTIDGTRNRTRWHSDYPNTTYGVSVAMTNYAKTVWTYNHPGGSMPVELYLYPETAATSLSQLSNLVEMITTLSAPETFGEYPFITEKYGIAQFNTNFGLEHQTITSQGNFDERRNVHELAHSWWGNSITCKSWHHVWVNEGWARYAESLFYERRPGGSYAAYLNHLNGWKSNLNMGGVIYRENIDSTSSIFSQSIVYNKGAWVCHMLRHVLGDSVFFDSLAAYRSLYEGGTAGIDDYQAVVESVSGRDMDWFFDEWIYSYGAPYYRYGWQQEQIEGQNYVRLHIEQYQDTIGSPSFPFMKMPVDVRLTMASGAETHVVFNESVAQQWFLLPAAANVTGVTLDPDTWILRGAASPVAYVGGPPKLLTAAPAPGAILKNNVSQVQLKFSQPISFQDTHFRLADAADIAIPTTVQYDAGTYTITLTPAVPLDPKAWTVSVDDQVATGGVALDGEIGLSMPVFPTGDGVPGGDAVYTFTISVPGDFDGDQDVDGLDAVVMIDCLAGPFVPLSPECETADLDGDDDADQTDFGLFQRCMSGNNVTPPLDCLGI